MKRVRKYAPITKADMDKMPGKSLQEVEERRGIRFTKRTLDRKKGPKR